MNIDYNSLWSAAQSKIGLKTQFNSIGSIISALIPLILTAAGIGFLIYLIMGGFQFMTSRGDPKAAQAAQGKITTALIGFIIIFIAYWIVQIIANVFGLTSVMNIFQ